MFIAPTSTAELYLWAVVLGAFLPLAVAVAFEFANSRARWALELGLYLLAAGVYVATLSGVLTAALGLNYPGNAVLPGLSALTTVLVAAIGVRNWLGTKKRDSFADVSLLSVVALCLVCAVAVLMFEHDGSVVLKGLGQLTKLSFIFCILCTALTSLLVLRAALHGDARAWEMFASGMLIIPASVALALNQLLPLALPFFLWVVAGLLYVVGLMVLARTAWRRGRHFVHVARMLETNSGVDSITLLPMGAGMIQPMDRVYSASLRRSHRPVLLMVRVFNADDILKDCGDRGLNEVLLATLARMRKLTTPADIIGRYFGACLVVQISGKVTPQYLRGLGLRLAASTRRPVVPRSPPSGFEPGEPIETDIGIGICWCDELNDLSLALHEAELACEAARQFRSRAAVKLGPDEAALPVEKALGEAKFSPSFLDSASAKIRKIPSQLMTQTGASAVLKKAVRKVRPRSAHGLRTLRGTAASVAPPSRLRASSRNRSSHTPH